MNWAKKTRRVTSFCHSNYGFPSISRPEKSRNNTGEKNWDIFSCVFDIANQMLTPHSPFTPLGQVDE